MNELITKLTHPCSTNIIVGDFNLPKINWSTLEIANDGVHDVIYNCLSGLGYTQFVQDVTHVTVNGKSNILDLIFSTDSLSVNVDDIDTPLGTSDHAIINFTILTPSNEVQSSNLIIEPTLSTPVNTSIDLQIFDLSSADFTVMNDVILNVNWHLLFGFNFDANSLWCGFKNIIWPIISQYVPRKMVKHSKKYRIKQYPKHIRKLLTKKAAIWRALRISKTPELNLKYRNVATECKLQILKFDTEREEKLLIANNFGAFYKFVNKKMNNHSGIAPLKNADGDLLTSDIDRANILNAYFESVFTQDNGSLPSFPSRLPNDVHRFDIIMTPQIVFQILKKLKTNTAAGPDKLPPIFYHHTAAAISHPLSILFRTLIDTHSIPDE